jgi:hypothetical protein
MEAISIADLAEISGISRERIEEVKSALGIKCVRDGSRWLLTPSDACLLSRELDLPDNLQIHTEYAVGIAPAKNPNWYYCKIDGINEKTPVQIPRRFWGKMHGKRFRVEKVTDKNGTTWRHEWFRKAYAYGR